MSVGGVKQIATERPSRSSVGVVREAKSGTVFRSEPSRITSTSSTRGNYLLSYPLAMCDTVSTSDNTQVDARPPINQGQVVEGAIMHSCQHRDPERHILERVKEIKCNSRPMV